MNTSSILDSNLSRPETLSKISSWYNNRNENTPLVLNGVIKHRAYRDIRSALQTLTCWRRTYCLSTHETHYQTVEEMDFFKAQPSQRWGVQSLISPKPSLMIRPELGTPQRLALGELLANLVLGDELCSLLEKGFGVGPISIGTCELAAYENGDFLSPHADTHDARIVGVNIYMDSVTGHTGGRLGFANRHASTELDLPANSLSLIPIGTGRTHWVRPWRMAERGRYTISMSIRRNGDGMCHT